MTPYLAGLAAVALGGLVMALIVWVIYRTAGKR